MRLWCLIACAAAAIAAGAPHAAAGAAQPSYAATASTASTAAAGVAQPSYAATASTAAASAARVSVAAAGAQPTRFDLPAGELRLSRSRVVAGSAARITFTVRLDRTVRSGRLALTLPRRWTQRSGVSGIAFARLPRRGRGSSGRTKVTRSGRVVSFAFTRGRDRDSGSYEVRDNGLPAGTYRLPYSWREGGRTTARGTARVVVATRPRGR